MPTIKANLPFPRGDTYFQGTNISASDPDMLNLLGKTFVVEDDLHSSGRAVELMAVQFKANVTKSRGVMAELNTANSINRVMRGYNTIVGGLAHAVDDAYSGKTIATNDVGYVVVGGPVFADSDLDVFATISTHGAVTWDSTGRIRNAGSFATATDNYRLGVSSEYLTAGQTSAQVMILVGEGGQVKN